MGHNRQQRDACGGRCHRPVPFEYTLRPMVRGEDSGFVAHSWVESWHDGNAEMRDVRFAAYRAAMYRRVDALFARALVLVAFEPERPDTILGWACAERAGEFAAIHYVYVLHTRRERGLGSALVRDVMRRLDATRWQYTHATHVGRRIANRRGHNGEFNPCLLWERAAKGEAAA